MAATDARPVPIKNKAYRVYFPVLDNDGDLVTTGTGMDSERSLDGATFADCTNEATEIATNKGMYFLDLTATEMNTDCTCITVHLTNTDAKDTPIVLYPASEEDALYRLESAVNDASASTTVFVTDFTEVTTDHYKDAFLKFTLGANIDQVRLITGYNGSTKAVTCNAFTDAPADNDTFVIANI